MCYCWMRIISWELGTKQGSDRRGEERKTEKKRGDKSRREKGKFMYLRLQVIVKLPRGHLNQGILQVRFARLFLGEPDLMEALAADTPRQVGMELECPGTCVNNGQREGCPT